MNILLNEKSMRANSDRYIDFLIYVVRFHTFCQMNLGRSLDEYLDRMNDLQETSTELMREVPLASRSALKRMQHEMSEAVAQQRSLKELAEKFESALRGFLYVDETLFRQDYFDKSAFQAARPQYSEHLLFMVSKPLEDGNYDAAIQAAFKCMDQHLAKLLKKEVDSSLYGDRLINAAFSEDGGLLKSGNSNEKGLRTLAAGVNSLFRNAVAHKHTFNPDLETLAKLVLEKTRPRTAYDPLTAQTCLAIVALILKFATVLAIQKGLISEQDAESLPFGLKPKFR